MKKILILNILLLIYAFAYSQYTVTGTFPGIANQQVKLFGFEGFNTYVIDSVRVNEEGIFQLSFSKEDLGMGYLAAEDNTAFIVILAEDENLKLEGEEWAFANTVVIASGKQNQRFAQYASEHPRREQALSAWDYLEKMYKQDSLFANHTIAQQAIEKEKQHIKTEDSLFLTGLPGGSYVSWYLPVRKLVSSVSTIAQYRTEEIPVAIHAFRELDYTDERLYKSGLLRETIEAHFWLIENSGRSLDSVYVEMNISIDYMMENLVTDEKKFNEITEYLFRLLEQRSLFGASEYLALKVLNEVGCTINNDLAAQLESYRAMKTGNTAPDFEFSGDVFAPAYTSGNVPEKLSGLKSNYTVVIFAASWCPQCQQELSQIDELYQKWKKYNVEVVLVSVDTDQQTFNNFAGGFPFISTSDYQKWESPIVQNYHVFATPTMYLLDNKRKILLRPNSAKQMDSWVDWFLVQGNR
jgi:thiol-disulfide isomerase/thioredoxin